MQKWDKLDDTVKPAKDTIDVYVDNPLWDELCGYMEQGYGVRPLIEHSKCGAAPGWNVKYKKAGRSLCTLYPGEGEFTALVVMGQREKQEAELVLPSLSPYLRQLYRDTREGMGQRWLMIQVTSPEILEDVKRCIAIRRRPLAEKAGA